MIEEELWVLRGNEPVRWTVPVYLKWEDEEHGLLYYAMPLLAKQQDVVDLLLAKVAQPHQGMWKIRRTALGRVGDLTQGGDPVTFFSWERPQRERPTAMAKERRKDVDDFLDALYQAGVGRNREEVEYWWIQFCNHALDWLINKEKPVDMYFVKLHNSPYRMNWRQAVLGRFPRIGKLLAHSNSKDREYYACRSGLTDELLCLDLLAMREENETCYRHIEVQHRPKWWKAVFRVESDRLTRLGSAGYAAYFMDSIKRRLRVTLSVYMEWITAIARPSAADVESGRTGQFRFVPNIPPADLPSHRSKSIVCPIVVPNSAPTYIPPSKPKDLYPPHELLPAVPTVQPAVQDLRNGRPDLHRPPDWVEKKNGMLVLPAGEERPGGELLGVQRDQGESRLAEEPQLQTTP